MSDVHPDYAVIGAILRSAREAAGLKGREVAARLGRTTGSISQIESGKAKTSLQLLLEYGELVGVDVLLLMADEGDDIQRLAIRIARLLPTLDDNNLSTLRALVDLWDPVKTDT